MKHKKNLMPGNLGMISFKSMRNTFTCYIFVFVLSQLYIRIIIIEVADARRHARVGVHAR